MRRLALWVLSFSFVALCAGPGMTGAITEVDARRPRDVSLAGGHDSVSGAGGITVPDVREPSRSAVTTQVPMLDVAHDVATVGDTALVAAGEAGLAVVDLADPADPRLTTTLQLGFPAKHIAVAGDRAYLAGPLGPEGPGIGMLNVAGVDVSNPEAPALLQSLSVPGTARDVDAVDNIVFVAGAEGGVAAITLGGGGPLDDVAMIDSGDLTPTDVLVAGANLYLVESYDRESGEDSMRARLRIFDVGARPVAPRQLGSFDFESQPESRGMALAGTWLTLPASRTPIVRRFEGESKEDLLLIDVSDPVRPRARSYVSLDGYAKDVAVADDTAYVAAGREAFRFDAQQGESLLVLPGLTQPGGPRERWVAGLPAVPRGLALAGDHAVVALGEAGLAVVDVRPEVIGRPTATPTATDVPPPTGTPGPGTVVPTSPPTRTALSTETAPSTDTPSGTETVVPGRTPSPTATEGSAAPTPPTGTGRLWLPALARAALGD